MPTNRYKDNKDNRENQQIAYNYFIAKGLSPQASAGIVGNLMQESLLNPQAVGDNGNSMGIGQWYKERNVALKKAYPDTYNTLDGQLNFLWDELNSTHVKALEGLKNAQDVKTATIIFQDKFERPHPKYAQTQKRVQYAENLLGFVPQSNAPAELVNKQLSTYVPPQTNQTASTYSPEEKDKEAEDTVKKSLENKISKYNLVQDLLTQSQITTPVLQPQENVQQQRFIDPYAGLVEGLPALQAGGTVTVSDRNDPRYRAYQDSLALYYAGNKTLNKLRKAEYLQDMNSHDYPENHNIDPQTGERLNTPFNRLRDLNGESPQPIKRVQRELPSNGKLNKLWSVLGMEDRSIGNAFLYKKPEQEVVYEPSASSSQTKKIIIPRKEFIDTTPQVSAINATPAGIINQNIPISVNPIDINQAVTPTFGSDVFQNMWRAQGTIPTNEERRNNPNWDQDVSISFLRPPEELGITRQNDGRYATWNESYNNLVEGQDFMYNTPEMQAGGIVPQNYEADKEWLQNWYSNREIPNEWLQSRYEQDKPSFTSLSQFIPDPTIVSQIDPDNPEITGQYNAEENSILLTPNAQPSAYLHEGTHRTQNFPSVMRPIHQNIINQTVYPQNQLQGDYNTDYDYLTDPDEVHARIQVLRNQAGIQPDQKVTPEFLQNFLNNYQNTDSNINDLLNITDQEGLLQMLNYMAANQPQQNQQLQYSQQGGVIEDNRGQWAHPGQITKINSSDITMRNVPYPVLGIDNLGNAQMMHPNRDYKFEGTSVTEYPMTLARLLK